MSPPTASGYDGSVGWMNTAGVVLLCVAFGCAAEGDGAEATDGSTDTATEGTGAAEATTDDGSTTSPATTSSTSGTGPGTTSTSTTGGSTGADETEGSSTGELGDPPPLLMSEAFADADLAARGWSDSLQGCAAVADAEVGHDVLQCSFASGTDAPLGGNSASTYPLAAGVTEYTIRFKQRVTGGIVLGDQIVHGFMMMSNKGVHSPANSYGSMYFDPAREAGYDGEWVFVFQDNKALNCDSGTQVDLFAVTEDRSAGGCQTPGEHQLDDAVRPWCWGDACSGGLDTYTGQSGWTVRPNVGHPTVTVGEWVEFTYYVRLNTPGQFDGEVWLALQGPGDDAPVVAIDTGAVMMRAGGWNADMTVDKVFFGPWASSNSYTFEASFADLELWGGDGRPFLDML